MIASFIEWWKIPFSAERWVWVVLVIGSFVAVLEGLLISHLLKKDDEEDPPEKWTNYE